MKPVLLFLLLASFCASHAQTFKSINAGLYAPFAVQPGIAVGTVFPLGKGDLEKPIHSLQPSIAFAHQLAVGSSISIRADYYYRLASGKKGWAYYGGAGLGYLRSYQSQEGTVNLASGTIDRQSQVSNFIQPMGSILIRKHSKRKVQPYLRCWIGTSTSSDASTFFTAVELGSSWSLSNKTEK